MCSYWRKVWCGGWEAAGEESLILVIGLIVAESLSSVYIPDTPAFNFYSFKTGRQALPQLVTGFGGPSCAFDVDWTRPLYSTCLRYGRKRDG